MALGSPTLAPERSLPRADSATPNPEADEHPLEADRATEAAVRSVAEEADFLEEEAQAPAAERAQPSVAAAPATPRAPKDPDLHDVEVMLAGGFVLALAAVAALGAALRAAL